VDYGFHAMVNDPQETIFDELTALVEAGVPTIKLFMAYKGTPLYSSDDIIFRMLQKSKHHGVLVMVHGENADIIAVLEQQLVAAGRLEPKYHADARPPLAEAEATHRATVLAEAAAAPVFVVHISCAEAMEAVREAQNRGVDAFGETCPHYLTLSVDNLARADFDGAKYVCSPPLRPPHHFDSLWQALQNGWIQVVGSDHCGFQFKGDKELGREAFTKIPNGCPGVENRLAVLYTYGVLGGKLSLQRMVDVFATSPAKFYGLYPRKGSLTVGGDADIVIYDTGYEGKISVKTSLQQVDFNIYEGLDQKGRAEKVFLRGNLIVDNGQYVGRPGQGKFIQREPYGIAYAGRS
jgi:dihydropyrimidinase